LGFALAAWIAERHQTAIDVESLPGSGSKFAWTLPLAREIPSEILVDRDGVINECLPLASTQA
jgi:light-regulated signal transduction histidine kinase (bacteriophytochrome)